MLGSDCNFIEGKHKQKRSEAKIVSECATLKLTGCCKMFMLQYCNPYGKCSPDIGI